MDTGIAIGDTITTLTAGNETERRGYPYHVHQEGLVISQADDTAVRCISGDRCFYALLSSPYLGYALYERQRV
jgi:hypothetical protein